MKNNKVIIVGHNQSSVAMEVARRLPEVETKTLEQIHKEETMMKFNMTNITCPDTIVLNNRNSKFHK